MESIARKDRWFVPSLAIVAIAAVVAFSPTWDHPFVHDDQPAVRDNPVVQGSAPWSHVLTQPYWSPSISSDRIYRPVTTASFRLNALVSGVEPWGYHVANTMLHALASVLVAIVVMQLTRSTFAGLISSLFFALHPVHTEAIALIVGRSELLVLIFMLATTSLHLKSISNRTQKPANVSLPYHLMLSLLFALGLLSKEHGVFTLFIVASIDFLHWREMSQRRWRDRLGYLTQSHYLGMILVLAAFFLARWLVFDWRVVLPSETAVSSPNPLDHATIIEKMLTPLALVALSFRLMVLPAGHSPNWGAGSFDLASEVTRTDVLAGVAILLLIVIFLVLTHRHRNRLFIPTASLVALLAIPCHLLPVANWFFGERWLYAPSAFVAMMIASVIARRPKTLGVLILGLLPVVAYQSWRYQDCFLSNEALVTCVLEKHPNDYFALAGMCHTMAGDGRIGDADAYAKRMIEHHPDKGESWCFNAMVLADQGRFEEAGESIHRCVIKGGHLRLPGQIAELSDRISAHSQRKKRPTRPPVR